MYSQNNEEQVISDYFGSKTGSFLDLGAYDGINLSNTRYLVENGWNGVCLEPHPEIFKKLKENLKDYPNIYCYELAMGNKNGKFKLNANDTYYSTLIDSETERWIGAYQFVDMECEVIDFKSFMKITPMTEFDFISIDCEGLDYDILTQINLSEVKCSLICVETNGKETSKYIDYISQFNFKVFCINSENLIMGK